MGLRLDATGQGQKRGDQSGYADCPCPAESTRAPFAMVWTCTEKAIGSPDKKGDMRFLVISVIFPLTTLSILFAVVVATLVVMEINHFYDSTIYELEDLKALEDAIWRKIGPISPNIRRKRQNEMVWQCDCALFAGNCPTGRRGLQGQSGRPGHDGVDGTAG
ncbi:nematode cuticle collagen domain protein [Teladorsagia circumcincta]|uniref:Nematode cuticle collagen domain protein n=1 Tax=Teladorsagia circumcincta TaxID=45464 RepID=A0A2G9UUK1_TELCI|nr:nematode cuticle collagen domain protein [Teladorsagia circumcincta]